MTSKLDEIFEPIQSDYNGNEPMLPGTIPIAKQKIKDLMLEIVDNAHQSTTTLNTMPLVSSYRAVDDMKKFARERIEQL
jgi:hypothetical protein